MHICTMDQTWRFCVWNFIQEKCQFLIFVRFSWMKFHTRLVHVWSIVHMTITTLTWNAPIQIAPSVDNEHIWIRILNRKPWLLRWGDKNHIRQSTFAGSDNPNRIYPVRGVRSRKCRLSNIVVIELRSKAKWLSIKLFRYCLERDVVHEQNVIRMV